MLPSLVMAAMSIIAIFLDSKMVVGMFIAATVAYFGLSFKKEVEPSYLNTLLIATLFVILASFSLPMDVILASIFLVLIHEFRRGHIWNIILYTLAAFAFLFLFDISSGKNLDVTYLFFLALAGGLTASLVESIESSADKRITILIAVATVFVIFKIYMPSTSLYILALAFCISFVVSFLALKAGVADESGSMSATIVGTTLIIFTDIRYFLTLLSFYILGSVVTKYKYDVKLYFGVAEQAGGARGYANVFGNSLAPLFFAIHYGVTGSPLFSYAFVASLAAALGDTMASEIGKTSCKVYLVTNFKRVPPGESGGVSLIGEFAAISGAIVVALSALILGIIKANYFLPILLASFISVHIDSLLGATLERKGLLTNSAVNLLATFLSGVICIIFILLFYK